MINLIYKVFIIQIVLNYGVTTNSVLMEGSKEGLLAENGTEIKCVYTIQHIFFVSFMAFNSSSETFEEIATYIPSKTPQLNTQGQHLKGRVTLTPITQSSTKAVMTFNQLMCIDDTSYKCRVSYSTESGNRIPESNMINVSVQVPPSKPDGVSLVHMPAVSLVITTNHMEYSSSLPSTAVTSTETEYEAASPTDKQNTVHDTTTSTPYPDDGVFSNVSYKRILYSIQRIKSEQVISEGDTISVVCTGDVGKPPAEHIFQIYRSGHTISMTNIPTETSISELSENCSYYRTTKLTFQVTAADNNAVIRCVVNSSMVEPNMYIETEPIEVYSYSTHIFSEHSSTLADIGSSSGVDKKEKRSEGDLGLVVGIVVSVVTVIVVMSVIIACRRRKSKSPTFKNKTKSSNNGLEIEDINKHNEEYLKKQEEEEKKKNESNTPPQPAVYAQVNEATKSKNKLKTESPENADKQEEDTYAESQEGIYDKAGDRRHIENENVEHFVSSTNSSKQNSNGDTKVSIQTSQSESYANQGFEKDEIRKVATVSPTVRSSSGSLNDEQKKSNRNSQSKLGYENIMDTDQTDISEEDSSHRTAL